MKAGDMARKIDSIFENTDEIRVAELYNKGRSTRKVDFHAYSYINGGI